MHPVTFHCILRKMIFFLELLFSYFPPRIMQSADRKDSEPGESPNLTTIGKGQSLNTHFRTIFEFNNYSNSTLFPGSFATEIRFFSPWSPDLNCQLCCCWNGRMSHFFLSGALLRPFSFLPLLFRPAPAFVPLSRLVHGGKSFCALWIP